MWEVLICKYLLSDLAHGLDSQEFRLARPHQPICGRSKSRQVSKIITQPFFLTENIYLRLFAAVASLTKFCCTTHTCVVLCIVCKIRSNKSGNSQQPRRGSHPVLSRPAPGKATGSCVSREKNTYNEKEK